MVNLITDKEYRLSTRKYLMRNDYELRREPQTNEPVMYFADKSSKTFGGKFLFEDDAEEIKAHPFFTGIVWDKLHEMRPPFEPELKSSDEAACTDYFDLEEDILGSGEDDSSSFVSAIQGLGPDITDFEAEKHLSPGHFARWKAMRCSSGGTAARNMARKLGNWKRPRDKMLRDPDVGRQVMRLRKNKGFAGYTWRRPKHFDVEENLERVKHYPRPPRASAELHGDGTRC